MPVLGARLMTEVMGITEESHRRPQECATIAPHHHSRIVYRIGWLKSRRGQFSCEFNFLRARLCRGGDNP